MELQAIPTEYVIIAGTALGGAILALWKYVSVGNRKCEARNDSLQAEIQKTKDLLIKKSFEDVAKAEAREARAIDRSVSFSKILEDTSEVTRQAVKVLRRYDQDLMRTPARGIRPGDEETVEIFNERKPK